MPDSMPRGFGRVRQATTVLEDRNTQLHFEVRCSAMQLWLKVPNRLQSPVGDLVRHVARNGSRPVSEPLARSVACPDATPLL